MLRTAVAAAPAFAPFGTATFCAAAACTCSIACARVVLLGRSCACRQCEASSPGFGVDHCLCPFGQEERRKGGEEVEGEQKVEDGEERNREEEEEDACDLSKVQLCENVSEGMEPEGAVHAVQFEGFNVQTCVEKMTNTRAMAATAHPPTSFNRP